jgi:rhomboid protease GluP
MSVQPPPNPVPQSRTNRARPVRPRPYTVIGIMVVTGVIFLLQLASVSILKYDLPEVLGAKVNDLIVQGQLWRLVTPIFLHVNIIHIGFNLYAVYIFGPTLEATYGRTRFILLYLLGGIAGNVASFYFSSANSVGASTAIFGMVSAQGVLVFRNREFFGAQSRPILMNVLLVAGINLLIGATIPGIDDWGHLGGLVGGFAFAWFAGPLFKRETVVVDYGGSTSQSYSSLETPLPQTAVRVVNSVGQTQVWIAAGIELIVLAGLVFIRILNLI